MSRIGKKAVSIPSGVKVEVSGGKLTMTGPVGTLTLDIHDVVNVSYDDGAKEISVTRNGEERFHKAMHGTTRALIANMVIGVTKGYSKGLEIYGTGYGVKVEGQTISLNLGFAKPAVLKIPDGVTLDIKTPNARGNDVPAVFSINSPDKAKVGQFAAEIRRCRPPEPYLGKGVRYADEIIKRKVGKAFGSGG